MMETQNVDKNLLTVDELKTMLKEKEGASKESSETPKELSSEKLCSFKPTKANQVECKEVGHFHYGDRSFCKKHNRTVQALNFKKAYEEAELQAKAQATLEKVQAELDAVKAASAKEETTKNDSKIKKAIKEETKKAVKLGKTPKNVAKTALKKPAVIKRKIKQNKWGRYEDSETGILFDPQTKAAFGVQDRKKGRILPLNKNAIDTCEKYGWKYVSIKAEEEASSSESEELQPNIREEDNISKSSSVDEESSSADGDSVDEGSSSDNEESGDEESGSDNEESGDEESGSGEEEETSSGSSDDETDSGSGED